MKTRRDKDMELDGEQNRSYRSNRSDRRAQSRLDGDLDNN